MNRKIFAIAVGVLLAVPASVTSTAQDMPACELNRPIVFADLGYDSALFHNAVARLILEAGYGCRTDAILGETIPLINGVARGDIDVIMEIWTANPAQAWVDAAAAGTVVPVGSNFPDATEGWFVPRYVVEGPDAIAPGLRSVFDLADYAALFADPEVPGRGRFYNCPPGQVCEIVNSRKLRAYGLDAAFTNFNVTSQVLVAVVESAILRQEPILFYYWGPSWLLGRFDLYQLEEPPFDQAVWDALNATDNPTEATAYPVSDVIIGANAAFAAAAPGIVAFLDAYETTSALVSTWLAYMQENGATPEAAARAFLAADPEAWAGWVSPEVAARVQAALAR